jgi:hypothetical protein
MSEISHILFCESPFAANKVDPDYEEEFETAKKTGFVTLLFNFENLISVDDFQNATRKIKFSAIAKKVIYRGWMLTPKQYSILYNDLLTKNYELINSMRQYQNCHYLPDSLKFIEGLTPKTIFRKLSDENSIDELVDEARTFEQKPVILKDYVKSEKHYWDTACFVPNASDSGYLKKSIQKLIELRGQHLNEGIVIREFIALNDLTVHSRSGMPLTEEYRLFFLNRKLVGVYDYWEEGEYKLAKPDTTKFEKIASGIDSNFFSMDIARQKDGKFIIIELGDGQVAGLPDRTNKLEFYSALKKCF